MRKSSVPLQFPDKVSDIGQNLIMGNRSRSRHKGGREVEEVEGSVGWKEIGIQESLVL